MLVRICIFDPIVPDKKNETYGYIITTPKREWKNFNIIGVWKKKLGIKKMSFDIDVNGAYLGEELFVNVKNINIYSLSLYWSMKKGRNNYRMRIT